MEAGIHDLAAAYALDALEPEDRVAFEDHLEGCAACRDEVASFHHVGAALALATAGPEPRPELRDRILAAAAAEPRNVVALAPHRRRLAVPVLAVAAAAAAVAAIALGAWATSLSGRLDDTRAALTSEQRATAVLGDPASRRLALAAGDGRLVVGSGGRAVLVLDRLPAAGSGRTYQAWVVAAGAPTPAGLFQSAGDTTVVAVSAAVPDGAVVAVTIEPSGGSERPTSDPLAASTPV